MTTKMAASSGSGHLVDDFEGAFQNCIAAISSQEHINVNDPDEVKTSVEQSIQKFLDVAKELESYFLQKRFVLSIYKPEQILKEDIQELRNEVSRKDALLMKHQEKLQQWQTMLARAHGATATGTNLPGQSQQQQPSQTQSQVPQQVPQQQQQQPHSMPPTSQPMASTAQPQPPPPPPPSQAMPPPSANTYPGPGPLAYLEQTTSNIGMPERR